MSWTRSLRPRAVVGLTGTVCLALSLIAVISAPVGSAPVPGGPIAAVTHLIADFGCADRPAAHHVACHGQAMGRLGRDGRVVPQATSAPVGYGPADIRSAYKLTGRRSHGALVAIVDAYDDPKAESDLAVYRATYGLPPCTSRNRCFTKVNQFGARLPLPARNYDWAFETSLDLDGLSATCPDCRILLVEAASTNDTDLARAVDTAARLGAVAISNSYGEPESAGQLALDRHFRHPGTVITVSAGDGGYGVSWPAANPNVLAVGGTTLVRAANARGFAETAWAGTGSGCSKYERKPAWQVYGRCRRRTVADVAADANPATGIAVYDTANDCTLLAVCGVLFGAGLAHGTNGWIQAGGTSLAAPIIAGVSALGGGSRAPGVDLYSHASSLYDIRSGANGRCRTYLCTAGRGYDGPTGLGTPKGVGAF